MLKKKPWWKSKTIWGIAIAAAGMVLKNNKVDFDLPSNADATQIVDYYNQVKENQGGMVGIFPTILSTAGFIVGIYGRLTAEAEIKKPG